MKKIILTPEQQEPLSFVPKLLNDDKIDSVAFKAFAGCGKSFILKRIAIENPTVRIQGLAFNNSIATENKASFPKRNTKWSTVHVFAKEYLKANNINIDFKNSLPGFKPLELIDILDIKDSGNYLLANNINHVMKVYSQSSLEKISPENIRKAGRGQANHDIFSMNDSSLEQAVLYAQKLWNKFADNSIPPTFDFYLKFFEVNRFAEKIKDFDLLELDEAQDSNAVTMSIVTQLPTKNIYVGDEHQSIYAFRGTLNAMNYADKVFHLATTFRYTPKIANFANKLLYVYKGEKIKIKSMVKEQNKIDGTRAFLSRNNSSMISLINELVEKNIFFKTVKKPEELFAASLALLEFRQEKTVQDKNFMYLKKFQNFEQVEEYIQETNDNELKTALKMQGRYGKRLYKLRQDAKNNYRTKGKSNHILSTAHTSKGLEWDDVELLNDFPNLTTLLKAAKIGSAKELIRKANKKDVIASQIVQEINLYYVASTRARFNIYNREVE